MRQGSAPDDLEATAGQQQQIFDQERVRVVILDKQQPSIARLG
jgi:hypothetical protein